MKRFFFVFAVLSSMLSGSMSAFAAQFDISGYIEPQYLFLDNDEASESVARNRLKVNAKFKPADGVSIEADAISMHYFKRYSVNLADFLPDRIRQTLPPQLRNISATSPRDSLYFDNVFLKLSRGKADVTVGKQQLEFGPGYFSNPVNMFSRKDIIDPTYEKTGHKAIRGDLTLAPRSVLTVFATSDDDIDHISDVGSAVRLTVPAGHFDLGFTLAEREWLLGDYLTGDLSPQQRSLYGFDAVGELLGAGVWTEFQYSRMEREEDFYELLAGVDYTFTNKLYLMAEYYHGSLAASDTESLTFSDWMRYFNNEVLAVSSDQLYLYSEYPAGDYLKLGFAVLASLNDSSCALVPSVRYNFQENLMLTMIGQIYTGRDGTAFGTQLGKGGLCRLTWYF
ncbi:MAG TPA: hypothetical protein ENL07_11825 [Chlorobaculum parvum]|uniref:Phosphate-selective porin O and P n=1 Tax=Chlorobaculum parvum TaxID=274539 RepID=A0A7C5DFS6_9CHLB|nr:hypothetical protein [Chlorobaculum parvum]